MAAESRFECPKCKDTGSGFVPFYSGRNALCDCARGRELARLFAMTPAEQNAEAARKAEELRAEARAARHARRAARA